MSLSLHSWHVPHQRLGCGQHCRKPALPAQEAHQPRRSRLPSKTVWFRSRFPAAHAAVPAAAAGTAAASLIAQPWTTLSVLCSCAAAAQIAEEHTSWGKMLSAPLLALLAALTAAGLGLLPPASPVYDLVWSHLMPLAVALFLMEHDVSSIAKAGGPVLISFLLGTGTMIVGAALAWMLCRGSLTAAAGNAAVAAKLAACLVASYIGGSINFVAVAAATQLPAALMPGAMAADNLGMLVLLAALMAAPLSWLQRQRQQQQQQQQAATSAPAANSSSGNSQPAVGIHDATPEPRKLTQPLVAAAAAEDGRLGLDGQPLLTEPPRADAFVACMEATSSGSQQQCDIMGPSSSVSSRSRSSNVSSQRSNTAAAPVQKPQEALHGSANGTDAQAAQGGVSKAAAAAGKCGGCRASGVTALDEHPLLTSAPLMGDAISNISAARQGKQQVMTPPKPPAAGSWVNKPNRSNSSNGNGNGNGKTSSVSNNGTKSSKPAAAAEEDVMMGCGCCSEALDNIAAASPAPAALQGGSSNTGGKSSTASGPLALDGSPLFTEEPDARRMEAAVAAARSGSKSGSIAVTPLSSGDFELLVKFDPSTLVERLNEQRQQQQQQTEVKKTERKTERTAGGTQQPEKRAAAVAALSESAAVTPSTPTAPAAAALISTDTGVFSVSSSSSRPTSSSAAAALAAAACACSISHQLASWLAAPALQQLLLGSTALTLAALGTAISKLWSQQQNSSTAGSTVSAGGALALAAPHSPFAGATQLGQLLIGIFFATLGASCCCPLSTLACCLPLLGFIGVMTATHWALMAALGGQLLQLPVPALLCGSAAAIGGPATAAGLAAARGWDVLVQPSLLCGSLGYALGTGAGLLLAQYLGVLPAGGAVAVAVA